MDRFKCLVKGPYEIRKNRNNRTKPVIVNTEGLKSQSFNASNSRRAELPAAQDSAIRKAITGGFIGFGFLSMNRNL